MPTRPDGSTAEKVTVKGMLGSRSTCGTTTVAASTLLLYGSVKALLRRRRREEAITLALQRWWSVRQCPPRRLSCEAVALAPTARWIWAGMMQMSLKWLL